jgi:hypothetical protein
VLTYLAKNLKKQCTRRSSIAALTNLVCQGEFVTAEEHHFLNQIQENLACARFCGTDDSISETLVKELNEQIKQVLRRAEIAADAQFNLLLEEESTEKNTQQRKREKGKAKRKKNKKNKKKNKKGERECEQEGNEQNEPVDTPCRKAQGAAKHPAVSILAHSTPHQKMQQWNTPSRMVFHCTPELGQICQRRGKGGHDLDGDYMDGDYMGNACFETPSQRRPLDLLAAHGRWSV